MDMSEETGIVFISILDAAELFGCSPVTVFRLINRGMLPPLLGRQQGLSRERQGWCNVFYEEWMRCRAQRLEHEGWDEETYEELMRFYAKYLESQTISETV